MAEVIAWIIAALADEKTVHPAVNRERGEQIRGVLIDRDADVEHPTNAFRIATCGARRGVDLLVGRDEVRSLNVAERRHPAVREPAGDAQHPWPVRTEPDAHRM